MATAAPTKTMDVEAQKAALEKLLEQSPSCPVSARPRKFRGWEEGRAGLLPGDHVWVNRGIYNHHGIYVGDGMFVHKVAGASALATASLSKAVSVLNAGGGLIHTGFEGFAPDPLEPLHVVQYPECFHPQDTVELAFSCLKIRDLYRLMDANCEHFATWCKTGRKESGQVIAVKNALFQSSAAISAFTVGIAVFARLAYAEVMETTVAHIRGKGIGRLFGLGRKTITTTTVSVDRNKVYSSAGVAGVAGILVYRVARGIKRWVLSRRKHYVAVRFEAGDATVSTTQTLEGNGVAVHKWRVRNAAELLKLIQKALSEGAAGWGGGGGSNEMGATLPDLMYFSPSTGTYSPFATDDDIRRLPRVTSLKFVRRPSVQ